MSEDAGNPFDARRIWMSDSEEDDLRAWHIVSLVTALREVLGEGPAGDGNGPVSRLCPDTDRRLAFLHAVIDELGDRGLDAHSLIRYGLMEEVLSPVLGTLMAAELLEDDALDARGVDAEAWRRTFGLAGGSA